MISSKTGGRLDAFTFAFAKFSPFRPELLGSKSQIDTLVPSLAAPTEEPPLLLCFFGGLQFGLFELAHFLGAIVGDQ